MRVNEVAVLVHGPNAVGIPVGRYAEIAHAGADGAGQSTQIFCNRFGMNVAEARIHLAADLADLTARPLQKGFNDTPSRSVHRIHHETLRVFGNHIAVDQLAHVREIIRQGIEFLDKTPFARQVEIHQVGAASALFIIIKVNFHPVALFIQGRAAIGSLELDAVVAWGIMGGSDHHPGDGAKVFYGIGDGRGGRV